MNFIGRIISGGQTGADRGALQAAIDSSVPHGGSCPKARLAEDGSIPGRFLLKETKETDFRVRTLRNVLDSDGTLIFCYGAPQGGTALTLDFCRKHSKPFFLIDLASEDDEHIAVSIRAFTAELSDGNSNIVLNVAGARESVSPGIFQRTHKIMTAVLLEQKQHKRPFSKTFLGTMPLLWTCLVALLFAQSQIQIDPSAMDPGITMAQTDTEALTCSFTGNQSLTCRQTWLLIFIFTLFHLPHFFNKNLSLLTEIRILSLFAFFLIFSDLTYLLLNLYSSISAYAWLTLIASLLVYALATFPEIMRAAQKPLHLRK